MTLTLNCSCGNFTMRGKDIHEMKSYYYEHKYHECPDYRGINSLKTLKENTR